MIGLATCAGYSGSCHSLRGHLQCVEPTVTLVELSILVGLERKDYATLQGRLLMSQAREEHLSTFTASLTTREAGMSAQLCPHREEERC